MYSRSNKLFSVQKQLKNKELTIVGSHWPIFVYKKETYNSEGVLSGIFFHNFLTAVWWEFSKIHFSVWECGLLFALCIIAFLGNGHVM